MNGGRTVPGVVIVSDILIDVIEEPDGSRVTRAGGAGFNLAASVARLGVPATLIAPVAEDAGGRFLSDAARAARVSLVNLENPWPTTVAISRRVNGEPQYTFSEWMRERRFPLASVDASALEGNVLAVNSFPMNDPVQVEDLTRFAKSAGLMLVTDPNARPTLLGDLAAYRGGVETLASASVAIKLSTEDIENLDWAPRTRLCADCWILVCRRSWSPGEQATARHTYPTGPTSASLSRNGRTRSLTRSGRATQSSPASHVRSRDWGRFSPPSSGPRSWPRRWSLRRMFAASRAASWRPGPLNSQTHKDLRDHDHALPGHPARPASRCRRP